MIAAVEVLRWGRWLKCPLPCGSEATLLEGLSVLRCGPATGTGQSQSLGWGWGCRDEKGGSGARQWAVPRNPSALCPVPLRSRLVDMSGASCCPLALHGVQEWAWAQGSCPEKGLLLGKTSVTHPQPPASQPSRPALGSRWNRGEGWEGAPVPLSGPGSLPCCVWGHGAWDCVSLFHHSPEAMLAKGLY